MHCIECKKEAVIKNATKADRNTLPRGWKKVGEAKYCDKCWNKKYYLKAISIPVLKPLGEGVGWPEFRKSLNAAWVESTSLSNWMSSEMYARDIRRALGDEKLGPMPKIYLYPEAVKIHPEIPSGAVASMEQTIKRRYSAKRFQVLWTRECSISNYRYPYPAAFPRQSWKPSYETAGKESGDMVPCVSLVMRRGERFLLQLRSGQDFRRQLSDFKAIVDGRAFGGEISFVRKKVSDDHRNGVSGRDSGGQKARYRVMCKIAGWFPRKDPGERSGMMFVRTDVDAMVVALDEKGERLWWYNGDDIKRLQARHKRRLDRLADDHKNEYRPHAKFQSLRETWSENQQNYLKNSVHQIANSVCGLASRKKYAVVKYDDSERRYCEQFPWFSLASRLESKCTELGLEFIHSSAEVKKDTEDSLEEA